MKLIENDGQHLHSAIATTKCDKHDVKSGIPCYTLPNNAGISPNPFHYGICGDRIRSAGYNGKISPESMRRRPPAKKGQTGDRKAFKKPSSRPASFNRSK